MKLHLQSRWKKGDLKEYSIVKKKIKVDLSAIGLQLKGEYSRAELTQHCINHSTYHRRQLITIARSIGIDKNLPSTDFFFFISLQKRANI